MTLSQALIGEAIPPRERARYQGYLAAVAVCANTFGPVAGGYLTEHFGWQSIFLVNMPIGLGAVALTWRLPSPKVERLAWRADPGGLILFTVFVATTLLSLEQVQHVDLERRFRSAVACSPPASSRWCCWFAMRTGRRRRSFRSACCASRRSGTATRLAAVMALRWCR